MVLDYIVKSGLGWILREKGQGVVDRARKIPIPKSVIETGTKA